MTELLGDTGDWGPRSHGGGVSEGAGQRLIMHHLLYWASLRVFRPSGLVQAMGATRREVDSHALKLCSEATHSLSLGC